MKPLSRDQLDNGSAIANDLINILERIDALNTPAASGRVCERCGGLRSDDRRPCDVCNALRHIRRRTEFAEEVEWIIGTDTPESIMRRLGYTSMNSLVRQLERCGRRDLVKRLGVRDGCDRSGIDQRQARGAA